MRWASAPVQVSARQGDPSIPRQQLSLQASSASGLNPLSLHDGSSAGGPQRLTSPAGQVPADAMRPPILRSQLGFISASRPRRLKPAPRPIRPSAGLPLPGRRFGLHSSRPGPGRRPRGIGSLRHSGRVRCLRSRNRVAVWLHGPLLVGSAPLLRPSGESGKARTRTPAQQ